MILGCGESASRRHALTPIPRHGSASALLGPHTSGRSDNLELTRCPRLLKFPVLLFLLAILNRRRQLPRLHRSSRHRLPRCRHRLALFLRLNRCQHRPRSRGTSRPGTSCLATIVLSLRDKKTVSRSNRLALSKRFFYQSFLFLRK